jgi:hypothetical protein
MAFPPTHSQAVLELEARHDELLVLLADLEKRVAAVLAQHAPPASSPRAAPAVQAAEPPCSPARAAA